MTDFEPRLLPPDTPPAPDALVYAFSDRRVLVRDQPQNPLPSWSELTFGPLRFQHLGFLGERQVVSAELAGGLDAPDGMAFRSVRGFLLHPPDATQARLAGRAVQVMEWDRDHQFCGRCGTPTEASKKERSRRCPSCRLTSYPRVAPAVIVLVTRNEGREVLLARSPHFPPGMYSTLAGFVEPGETLDECIVREIREEVGVTVGNARYFGSQPWPFPHSLMLGFYAEYLEGDIVLEEEEIADAQWYSIEDLPQIPPRISIARALIDGHLEAHDLLGRKL